MSTTTTLKQQFVITFKINNRKTPPQNNNNELMQVVKSQTHTHARHTNKPQNHKQILLVLAVVSFPIPA